MYEVTYKNASGEACRKEFKFSDDAYNYAIMVEACENVWASVNKIVKPRRKPRRKRINKADIYASVGMVKVRGALGGTYYE